MISTSEFTVPDHSLQYLSFVFAQNFPSIVDQNSSFMLFMPLWYRHRRNVQPESTGLARKAKEGNSRC